MWFIEIRLRSFPQMLRTSRPPPSPSHSSTFYSSDIDIHNRRPQRSESESASSSSSYLIGRSRLRARRIYRKTGREGMNPPHHKSWFCSWFHRGPLPPRRETNFPRREQIRRAFVVDAPEDTRACRYRRQSPLPPTSRAPPVSRARPASSRMDTFASSRVRSRSHSRDRDAHEVREVHTEDPRTEKSRRSAAPRGRPVSPRRGSSFAGWRGRSRSRSRPPQEIHEVVEARPTEPDIRQNPTRYSRPPRERTPVVEREPRRSGRWISPVRQGRSRRTSAPLDRRPDPARRFASTDEDVILRTAVPRSIVRQPEEARGMATREERRTMPPRIPSPIPNNPRRSGEEPRPRRTVERNPQPQLRPNVIERRPRAEQPQVIQDGRRGLFDSAGRYIHRDHIGDAPRVRFQEPSHFWEPQLTRVFRRRRNRQERFIDERGPLDRWR